MLIGAFSKITDSLRISWHITGQSNSSLSRRDQLLE